MLSNHDKFVISNILEHLVLKRLAASAAGRFGFGKSSRAGDEFLTCVGWYFENS
jgi:hypothetical protein